jgi:ribosomal protein S20
MIARIATIAGVTGGIALLVGGAVTVAGVASGANPLRSEPVAAASPAPSSGGQGQAQQRRQAACQAFLGHLASDLGISQDKLNGAVKQAGGQTIDDAVRKGDLTQQQANQLKSKLSEKDACSGRVGGLAAGRNAVGKKMLLQAAAQALNTSPDQLAAQLKQGKSISQIAPQGMTEEQFQSALQASLKSQLDSAVKSGKITQAQEDQALQRVPEIAQRAWTSGIPQRNGKSGSPSGGASPAPQATPTPGS